MSKHGYAVCISLLLCLLLLACGLLRRHPRAAIRPGESLFDILTSASVDAFPATNLPDAVAGRVVGPFRLRTREIRPHEWVDLGILPLHLRKVLEDQPDIRHWEAKPAVHSYGIAGELYIFLHGTEVPPTHDLIDSPFPGLVVWWNKSTGSVFALSSAPPIGVSVEYVADPKSEFGENEITSFAKHGSPETRSPRPADLVRMVEMGATSRRSLFLPAPGSISIPVGTLGCDELRIACGLIDRSYKVIGERLEQTTGGSDGIDLTVQVSTGGRSTTVWQQSISTDQAGIWQPEVSVNLSSFFGKQITITLISEPGVDGDSDFDYAVFGGLRLYGKPKHQPKQPHIVLIDIDTLRRDRLGCYDYTRSTTPRLDRWAASRAVVYKNCISTAPWTLPSTASIFTGLAVHQHQIDAFPEAMTQSITPIPLKLQRSGYETFGISEGGYVGSEFGFDLGFDVYDCNRFKTPDWNEALEWIRSRRSERPFFMFLHTYLVHAPYPYDNRFEDPKNPYVSHLAGEDVERTNVMNPYMLGLLSLSSDDKRYINDLYDARVYRMDEIVGNFIDSLSLTLQDEKYALLFTSDHGEEFFEHGKMGHGQSLFRELLDVPLIVQFPKLNGEWRTGISNAPVSTLDIVPTILDWAEQNKPPHLPGRSLLGELHDDIVRVAYHSEKIHSIQIKDSKLVIRQPGGPKQVSPTRQLYMLNEDPMETTNLAQKEPKTVRSLIRKLRKYSQVYPPLERPSDQKKAWSGDLTRLRALGYVEDIDTPSDSTAQSGLALGPTKGDPRRARAREK